MLKLNQNVFYVNSYDGEIKKYIIKDIKRYKYFDNGEVIENKYDYLLFREDSNQGHYYSTKNIHDYNEMADFMSTEEEAIQMSRSIKLEAIKKLELELNKQ